MTPVAEAFKKEHQDRKEWWQNELKSLGIEPRRRNELNDKEEINHWMKASNKSISKITKQHMATIVAVTNRNSGQHSLYEIRKNLHDETKGSTLYPEVKQLPQNPRLSC